MTTLPKTHFLPRDKPVSQQEINEFYEREITEYSFVLPGLGEGGEDCGANKLSQVGFKEDGSGGLDLAVKYEPLSCRRFECPDCYNLEVIKSMFDFLVVIEAYSEVHDVRPSACIGSVPPSKAKGWSRKQLNNSLFRRFRRRAGRYSNVGGGIHFFHPFRLKKRIKKELRDKGLGKGELDAGYWKGVREDALNLGDWREYVRLGPHIHNIVFPVNNPVSINEIKSSFGTHDVEVPDLIRFDNFEEYGEHKAKDFLIRFDDMDFKPIELGLKRLIAYFKYLFSHIGVRNFEDNNAFEEYFKPVRSFGSLYGFRPEEELDDEKLIEIKERVAEHIFLGKNDDDEVLTCEYDSENDELVFPYSSEDSDVSHEDFDFYYVWNLNEILDLKEYKDLRDKLSEDQKDFLGEIWAYCKIIRGPPPFEERGLNYPDPEGLESVTVFVAESFELDNEGDSDLLR